MNGLPLKVKYYLFKKIVKKKLYIKNKIKDKED